VAVGTWIGEGLQAIIYNVATLLLYPVLALEVLALVFVAFELGRFSVEVFRRWRSRKRLNVEAAAASVTGADSATDALAAVQSFAGALAASPVAKRLVRTLAAGELSRTRVLKAIADSELEATRRLERTRMMIRFGPILGLMGTLIPISPALVALAKGDVTRLSNNLVIAFSTTVVGLLIGGLGYLMTTVRDRYYQQDVVDLEYVLDRLEV
jgi:biopolymer transport protein ExbB/TolQ